MGDISQPAAPEGPLVNKTLRAVLGIGIVVFSMGVIVWLLIKGSTGNSLHESSLSWAWFMIVIMAATFGIGNAIPSLINLLPKAR